MDVQCPKCKAVHEETGHCGSCGGDVDQQSIPSAPEYPAVSDFIRICLKISAVPNASKKQLVAAIDRLSGKIGIDVNAVTHSAWRAVALWCRDVFDLAATILVCALFAWVVCVFLLSLGDGLWALYRETEVGKQYLLHFPFRASAISRIFNAEPFTFSFFICLTGLKAGLIVAAVARISFFARVAYENRTVIFRVALWVPACAAVGAYLFQYYRGLEFQFGFMLTLFPALVLFHPCFELAEKCLPEANLFRLFRMAKRLVKHGWRKIRFYIAEIFS